MAHNAPGLGNNWRQQAERLLKEARVLYFVSKHPRTRWHTKWVAACSVAYLFSPVQLIPSFIPVIGFLDDFLALFVGAKVVRKFTPPDVLQECREFADASEIRRKEDIRSGSARSAVFVMAVWVAAAVVASAIVFAFVYHF